MVTNNSFPKDGKVGVSEMKVSYIQENDTCGESGTYQQLSIEVVPMEYVEKENIDGFLRISIGPREENETDVCKYFSIDDLCDFEEIFNDFERRRGSNVRFKITKEFINDSNK